MKTKAKNKGGRPSKKEELNFTIARNLAERGFTVKELSQTIEVNEDTIYEWMKDPKFSEAIKKGREIADMRVEDTLYKRALGYEYDEVTYEKSKVGGLGIKLSKEGIEELKHTDTNKVKVVTKQVAGDVTAQIFWLKNRKPDQWREKKEGDGDTYINNFINSFNSKDGKVELTETQRQRIREEMDGLEEGISSGRSVSAN